jgi:predicted RNA-binding Zn-ribbon protein involved in translation (DUF1610 family)
MQHSQKKPSTLVHYKKFEGRRKYECTNDLIYKWIASSSHHKKQKIKTTSNKNKMNTRKCTNCNYQAQYPTTSTHSVNCPNCDNKLDQMCNTCGNYFDSSNISKHMKRCEGRKGVDDSVKTFMPIVTQQQQQQPNLWVERFQKSDEYAKQLPVEFIQSIILRAIGTNTFQVNPLSIPLLQVLTQSQPCVATVVGFTRSHLDTSQYYLMIDAVYSLYQQYNFQVAAYNMELPGRADVNINHDEDLLAQIMNQNQNTESVTDFLSSDEIRQMYPQQENIFGQTPLHYYSCSGDIDKTIELLTGKYGNPYVQDHFGRNVFYWCWKSLDQDKYNEMKRVLLRNIGGKLAKINYVNADLIDSKGARDFIIIDGYALLFEMLNNQYLDWNDHGGQFIQLTALVSQFINDLTIREIEFEVVFAGSNSEVHYFAESPQFNLYSVTLAKQLIISYLNQMDHVVHILDSDWTKDNAQTNLGQYLDKKVPMFMIGTDRCQFGKMFMHFCHLNYNLPSAIGLYFEGNTVYGKFGYLKSRPSIQDIIQDGMTVVANVKHYAVIDKRMELSDETLQSIQILPGTVEEKLIITAICRLVQASLQESGDSLKVKIILSQFLLMSCLVSKQVPFRSRAQKLLKNSEMVNEFINVFYQACLQQVTVDVSLVDILDARLFHRLVVSFSENLSLMEHSTIVIKYIGQSELYTQAQELILSIAKIDTASANIPQLTSLYTASDAPDYTLPEVQPLYHVQNELVDAVLEDWKGNLVTIEANEDRDSTRIFEEKWHWHVDKLLERREQFIPRSQIDKDRQSKAQERLREYSKSLLSVIKQKIIEVNRSSSKKLAEPANSQIKREYEFFEKNLIKYLAEEQKKITDILNDNRSISEKVAELQKEIDNVTNKLHDDSGIYNKTLAILRKENQIGYDEIELEVLQETLRREAIAEAQREEEDDEIVSEQENTGNGEDELEDWETLDLNEPEPPVNVEVKPEPKSDNTATLKRIQELQHQIRLKENNMEHLELRMKIVTKCRQQVESFIVNQMLTIASLLISDKDRTETKDWEAFEACSLLHAYIVHLQSEQYRDIVSMRTKMEGTNTLINQEKIFDKIYEQLCSIGFVQYAIDLVGDRTKKSIKRNTQEHISVFQLKHNAACATPDKYLATHELYELNKKRHALTNRLFYPSTDDATLDKMYNLGFKPDPWQQDIIGHVNNQKSIVISAPTSTGKTFIAFYVIEKVLRESNNGRVVFVCPTKALVNQIYAEVFARYKKSGSFLGIFTADDKVDVLDSQVLITVPEALKILLLTAGNSKWRSELKYVVIDEIHTMNDVSTGKTLEHILLMTNCNIIALSATIGNAKSFCDWLNYNKKNVELVEFTERPRPLEFFVYDHSKFVEVHPVSALNPKNIDSSVIKHMAAFSPTQCLTLYQHAVKVSSQRKEPNIFKGLEPAAVLDEAKIFSRSDFHNYAEKLKERLSYCAVDESNHGFIADLILSLSKPVGQAYELMNKGENFGSTQYLHQNLPDLVTNLKNNNMLPAISFSFDRRLCFKFAELVYTALDDTDSDLWVDTYSRSTAKVAIDLVVTELFKEGVEGTLLMFLEKGIACHYSGLPDNYCKEVERLFRMKMIPIIFSTTTLALGVNMPCKTVVIAGSSVFLTPAQFYQCSGRSGRRGFDNKGQVVLFGISRAQTNRLLTSKIPKVYGSMGLQHTFILRLMTLYANSCSMLKRSEMSRSELNSAIADIKRTLSQPLFIHGQLDEIVKNQIKHHFRYSIEVLLREGYLNTNGEAVGYAGLVSHLYFHEPANFVLVDFIKTGIIHDTLMKYDDEEKRAEKLIHILSYLFGRRVVYGTSAVLNPLPDEFLQANRQYTTRLMQIYEQYLFNYSLSFQDVLTEKCIPGSNIPVNTDDTLLKQYAAEQNTEIFNPFKVIQENQIPFVSKSAFVANSGHAEKYTSLSELLKCHNNNIQMDRTLIPNLDINSKLSSYILDFYKKPDISMIMQEHGFISESETFNAINNFLKDVRKIATSLVLMEVRKTDPLLLSLNKIIREIKARLNGNASYADSINIRQGSKVFTVHKVNQKKRLEMQIILHKHKIHSTPLLSTMLYGERDKFVTLTPKFQVVNASSLLVKHKHYMVIKSDTEFTLCMHSVKKEYECENLNQLVQTINEYKRMFKTGLRLEKGLELKRKERWGDKRNPDEEE